MFNFVIVVILLVITVAVQMGVFDPRQTYHNVTHWHRMCRMNAHVVGEWRRYERKKKDFVCCGWDGKWEFLWNTDMCGWNSRENEQLHNGHGIWLEQAGGHACSCDTKEGKQWDVSDREKWEWVPLSCDLVEWNATLFCDLLGNRTVLLAGDSTMRQTAQALLSMITFNMERGQGCAPQIWVNHQNYLESSFSVAEEKNVDIMIFNVGPHQWRSVSEFGAVLKHAEDNIIRIREQRGDHAPVFIWKSINPAHVSCQSDGELADFRKARSEWSPEDKYYWFQFERFDSFAKEWAYRMGVLVLDMSPLKYRQDAHPTPEKEDCLHYCAPGPLNIFSEILLTMLYTGEIKGRDNVVLEKADI